MFKSSVVYNFAQTENNTPDIVTVNSLRDGISPGIFKEIDDTTKKVDDIDTITVPSNVATEENGGQTENIQSDIKNVNSLHDGISSVTFKEIDYTTKKVDDIDTITVPSNIVNEENGGRVKNILPDNINVNSFQDGISPRIFKEIASKVPIEESGGANSVPVKVIKSDPRMPMEICDMCSCNGSKFLNQTPYIEINCHQVEKLMLDNGIIWPPNNENYDIKVTFQKVGLTELPMLPRNDKIVSVSFYDNSIEDINPLALLTVGYIMSLNFSKNYLRIIKPSMFNGLTYIEELDLSQNRLHDIELLDLNELIKLKKLSLAKNDLDKFPEKALRNITTLEFLDCSHNEIDVLTNKKKSVMSRLKVLDLNHNKITKISVEDFKHGSLLTMIDLSYNMISKIEHNAFDGCTSLTKLIVSNNQLKSIPSLPSNIQSLFLQNNGLQDLKNIPSSVQYLDISYNDISVMSEESYQNLETLNVKGNKLSDFNTRNPLNKLKILDLSYNRLEKVSPNFNKETLPSLDELYLDGNPLKELIFTGDIALRKLSASNLEEIQSLNEASFKTLTGKPLQNVDGSSIEGDDVCLNIIISNCKKLERIPEKTFTNISLCYLDLSFNKLKTLSKDVAEWPRLSNGVNLQGNPWDCGCHIQWILDDLLQNMIDHHPHVLNELRCHTPRYVNGFRFVHWYKWQEKTFCSSNLLAHKSTSYKQSASSRNTQETMEWNSMTIAVVVGIAVISIVVIGLVIYLIKGKHRHDATVRKMMMKKRQSMSDAQKLNKNGASQQNYTLLDT